MEDNDLKDSCLIVAKPSCKRNHCFGRCFICYQDFYRGLITSAFYCNADKREGRRNKHNITIAREASHSLAILCLLMWCHVLPSYKQYMPPYSMPLWTNGLRYAAARLRRHSGPHRHLLLPSSLLFFYVSTFLLPPLHGLHYNLWGGHHLSLPGACVPDCRFPACESWSLLLHGSIRIGAHDAQIDCIPSPAWGNPLGWLWVADGCVLWPWCGGLRYENTGAVDAGKVRRRRS